MNNNFTISIVVPALNEENNIKDTVAEIINCFRDNSREFEILIFDDNSTDKTGAIADELERSYENVKTFHNSSGKNIGGIYKAGLIVAKFEYYMLITGDNEVIIKEIIPALKYLCQADAVIFYHRNEHVRPLFRRILSRTYTNIINFLFCSDFKYTNDTNIYKKSILQDISVRANDFSYQTETLIKLAKKGLRFVEFGKDIRQRQHGKSKAVSISSFFKVSSSIFKLWLDVMVINRGKYNKKAQKIFTV